MFSEGWLLILMKLRDVVVKEVVIAGFCVMIIQTRLLSAIAMEAAKTLTQKQIVHALRSMYSVKKLCL